MEKGMTPDAAKQYLEEMYTHDGGMLPKETGGKRAFAARKKKLHEFVASGQTRAPSLVSYESDAAPNEEQPQQIGQEKVFNAKIRVSVPPLPSINIREPSLRPLDPSNNVGSNCLDRSTMSVIIVLDDVNNSLNNLLVSLHGLEKSSIQCDHSAKINKVMSSSSLRQLAQIQADHSNNGMIAFIWKRILDFLF